MFSLLLDRERTIYPVQKFYSRFGSADIGLVSKLEHREPTLQGHTGCVNTVSFTQDGSRLMSGSDDQQIIVWDYITGGQVLWVLVMQCSCVLGQGHCEAAAP